MKFAWLRQNTWWYVCSNAVVGMSTAVVYIYCGIVQQVQRILMTLSSRFILQAFSSMRKILGVHQLGSPSGVFFRTVFFTFAFRRIPRLCLHALTCNPVCHAPQAWTQVRLRKGQFFFAIDSRVLYCKVLQCQILYCTVRHARRRTSPEWLLMELFACFQAAIPPSSFIYIFLFPL